MRVPRIAGRQWVAIGVALVGIGACSGGGGGVTQKGAVGDNLILPDWRIVVRAVQSPYAPVARSANSPTPSASIGPIPGVITPIVPTITAPPRSPSTSVFAPQSGDHFVGVDVDLTNRADEVKRAGAGEIRLEDGSGHRFAPTVGGTFDPPAAGFEPGAEVHGVVTFEVPNSASSLTLVFAPDPKSTARIKVTG